MTERDAFGPTLRQHREQCGVTLESIATSTKISRWLFVTLERSDLSRWPTGIYRRSFFREYAAAIGVPVEATLQEFLRLFPEPGQEPVKDGESDDAIRLRLTLVPEDRWLMPMRQLGAASLDVGIVLIAGYALSMLPRVNPWISVAALALSYHALSTLLFGQSLGAWCLSARVTGTAASARQAIQIEWLRRQWLWDFLSSTAIRIRRRPEYLEPSL